MTGLDGDFELTRDERRVASLAIHNGVSGRALESATKENA
jgi:hypothetical protein